MNRIFVTCLFLFMATLVFSQFYAYVGAEVWNSPLAPKQVVQNNIKKLIVRRSWTSRKMCSGVRPDSSTTVYEYDRQGYPINISITRTDGIENYVCENDYKNNLLIKSVLQKKRVEKNAYTTGIFTQHFTADNLRDTSTCLIFGIQHYKITYHYDSLLRIIQTDAYKTVDSNFVLTERYRMEYDERSRPQHSVTVYMSEKPGLDSSITRREIVYSKSSKNFTEYEYGINNEKLSVLRTIYRGDKLKSVRLKRLKFTYGHRKTRKIEKVSEKKGIACHYHYTFYWRHHAIPCYAPSHREYFDAVSGLPLKKINFPRKSAVYPKGMKRETIVEYDYERY